MGIRVHKSLGYGLKNLRLKDEKLGDKYTLKVPDDKRWDYEKFKAEWDDEREEDLSAYLAWCEAHKDLLIHLTMQEEGCGEQQARLEHMLMLMSLKDAVERKDHWHAPYSALQWGNEYMLPKVMLFVPPEYHWKWVRHNDIIDYYEEQPPDSPQNRATFLPGATGIYPQVGLMRCVRPPSPEVAEMYGALRKVSRLFPHTGSDTVLHGGTYNRFIGRWSRDTPPLVTDPRLLRHLKRDWRPVLPMGVFALIEYLGCFPDPYGPNGIAASLKPMVYVYWG